jgi:general stress protein YciG
MKQDKPLVHPEVSAFLKAKRYGEVAVKTKAVSDFYKELGRKGGKATLRIRGKEHFTSIANERHEAEAKKALTSEQEAELLDRLTCKVCGKVFDEENINNKVCAWCKEK